jgi:hypothetical protein
VVEHSERESHLTPPVDALQWTILRPVTIQHQNRQIKITRRVQTIDVTHEAGWAARVSHQTPRGFGSTLIFWLTAAAIKSLFPSVKSLEHDDAFTSRQRSARALETTRTHQLRNARRSSEHARAPTDVNHRRVAEPLMRGCATPSSRSPACWQVDSLSHDLSARQRTDWWARATKGTQHCG